MEKRFFTLLILLLSLSLAFAQRTGTNNTSSSSSSSSGSGTSSGAKPSNADIAKGLKEALNQGISTAVSNLGKSGGFANDSKVRIPFPKDAQFVADALVKVGLGNLVTEFEKRLNEAGEDAVKTALPVFSTALTQMSFSDASNILLSGNQRSATDFFEKTTRQQLFTTFSPKIKTSLDRVNATKLWAEITTKYNAIPFVKKKVQTDLTKYVTNKALDGLFMKVAEEEAKIRQNPLQSASSVIQTIFGFALGKK